MTLTSGERKAKITKIQVDGINVFITVRNDNFRKRNLIPLF